MLPGYPSDASLQETWINNFLPSYTAIFLRDLSVDFSNTTCDTLVFGYSKTPYKFWLVPRPPSGTSSFPYPASMLYNMWTTHFSKILIDVQDRGYSYYIKNNFYHNHTDRTVSNSTFQPRANSRLVRSANIVEEEDNTNDVELPVYINYTKIQSLKKNYFVFYKDTNAVHSQCNVCYTNVPVDPRVYCDNGHWFCLDCCKKISESTKKECPVCRNPPKKLNFERLDKIVI